MRFDLLITRDDGPAKPDPWAITKVCETWNLDPANVVVVGDFRFDIKAGNTAGARTVYFTRGRRREALPGMENADHVLESFDRPGDLLAALGLVRS